MGHEADSHLGTCWERAQRRCAKQIHINNRPGTAEKLKKREKKPQYSVILPVHGGSEERLGERMLSESWGEAAPEQGGWES